MPIALGPMKLVVAILALLGLAALGAGAFTQPPPAQPTTQAKLAGEPAPPKVEAKGHVDREGFPLPAEAIARVGSARLRGFPIGYVDDDKTIVSGLGDKLQFWDAITGRLRRTVSEKHGTIVGRAFSADGKTQHLIANDIYLALDTDSGKELQRRPLPKDIHPNNSILSRNGMLVFRAASSNTVHVLDLTTGTMGPSWKLDGESFAHALTPDGKTYVVGGRDGVIRLFDCATGQSGEIKTSFESVGHVGISPDGATLLGSDSADGKVTLWDVKTRKERVRLADGKPLPSPISTAFTPDGRYVAMGSQDTDAFLFEVVSGKEVRRFRTWQGFMLQISRDSKTLLAWNPYGAITQWDIATGALLTASADPVLGLSPHRFVNGDKHLLVGDGSRYLLHDWRTGREIQRSVESQSSHPAISADGSLLASVLKGGKSIGLLDAQTGKLMRTLTGFEKFVWLSRFSPDGKMLYSSEWGGGAVRIWDVASGKQLHALADHPVQVRLLVPSPDGRWLATACSPDSRQSDAHIRIWETATGRLVRRITPPWESLNALAFAPTGTVLAASGTLPAKPIDRTEIRLFDVSSGAEIKTVMSQASGVEGLAFSPDGRCLAVASQAAWGEPTPVILWEVATGQERHSFEGHYGRKVYSSLFSPDGSLLADGGDGPLLIWDVYGKHGNPPAPPDWSAADKDRLWQELAASDARAAFQAIRRLVRNPAPAIALLHARLKAAEPPDAKQLKQLLDDLSSEDFNSRQAATDKLEKLGSRVEVPLRQALEQNPALETKRRLEALVTKIAASPERRRQNRALESLEQIATPDARQLLATLAAGQSAAWLTREAAASVDRMRKR